jgi:prepilin-type processing-associated H-X9-DG protein
LEQPGYYAAVDGGQFSLPPPWQVTFTGWDKWPSANGLPLAAFQCPDDPVKDNLFLAQAEKNLRLSKSNYLGVFSGRNDGDSAWAASNRPTPVCNPQEHAVFTYSKGTLFSDITDGTSNTLAVVEYLKGVDDNDLRGYFWTSRAGCQTIQVYQQGPNSAVEDSIYSGFCTADYNQPSLNLPCNGSGGNFAAYAGARSRHQGGVNTVFCDGSTHFIQDNIDISTWRNLGWIADGKAVSAE